MLPMPYNMHHACHAQEQQNKQTEGFNNGIVAAAAGWFGRTRNRCRFLRSSKIKLASDTKREAIQYKPMCSTFSFFFFFLSFLSFSVSHSLFLFRSFIVLSSCPFLFDSCIAFFAFTFASLLPLVADSVILVISARRYTPPHAPCEPEVCVFPVRAVLFPLSCVADVYLSLFFLLSLFRFRFGHSLFHPVFFLWVPCCLLGAGFC